MRNSGGQNSGVGVQPAPTTSDVGVPPAITRSPSTAHPAIRSWRNLPILAALLLTGAALTGCSGKAVSGTLRVESYGADAVTLPGRFTTSVYRPSEENVASFFLLDAPTKDMLEGRIDRGQFVHIELLWLPRAGKTPLDSAATNCSVRHVIFVGEEFGIYAGAGFAKPSGKVGSDRMTISVPEASLTLVESSAGWVDRLGPSSLTGSFTATLDDRLARRLSFAASQIVTNRLGRPRYVMGENRVIDPAQKEKRPG